MSGNASRSCARLFVLDRLIDISGVSGVGPVAEGVEWSDGTVSLRWKGEHPSITFWQGGISSVESVHGHGGATKVLYLDPASGARPGPSLDRPPRPPGRR